MFIEDGDYSAATEYSNKILDEDVECGEAYLGKLLISLKLRSKDDLSSLTTPFNQDPAYQKLMRFGSEDLVKELKEYNEITSTNYNETIYKSASSYEDMGFDNESIDHLNQAINQYKRIQSYKDSYNRINICQDKINEINYNKAFKLEEYASLDSLQEAINIYRKLSTYLDSSERINACKEKINEVNYNTALSLEKKPSVESVQKALDIYKKLVPYKDSADRILACNEKIHEIPYNSAKEFERLGTIPYLTKALNIYSTLTKHNFKDSAERYNYCKCQITYLEAQEKANKGQIHEAISLLKSIINFKDSREAIEELNIKLSEIEAAENRKKAKKRINELKSKINEHENQIKNWKIDENYRKKNVVFRVIGNTLITIGVLLFIIACVGCAVEADETVFIGPAAIAFVLFIVGCIFGAQHYNAMQAFNRVYNNLNGSYPSSTYFTSAISNYQNEIDKMEDEIEALERTL
jgi:hypothetical protein